MCGTLLPFKSHTLHFLLFTHRKNKTSLNLLQTFKIDIINHTAIIYNTYKSVDDGLYYTIYIIVFEFIISVLHNFVLYRMVETFDSTRNLFMGRNEEKTETRRISMDFTGQG